MIKTYNIPFNKKGFTNHLEGKLIKGKDWYGEIEINGVLTKLHWIYI